MRTWLGAALVVAVAAGCAPSSDLRLRVDSGRQMTYREDIVLETETKGPLVSSQKAEISLDKTLAFGRKAGDSQEIEVTANRASIAVSEGPGLDYAAAERALRQMRLVLTVDSLGQTRGYRDDGREKLNPAEAAMLGAATSTAKMLGPQGIVFDRGRLEVGQAWSLPVDPRPGLLEATQKGVSPAESKVVYSFKVTEVKQREGRKTAVIAMTSEGAMQFRMNLPGFPSTGSSRLESKGEFDVDVATGLVVSAEWQGTSSTDLGLLSMKQKQSSRIQLKSRIE